MKVDALKKSRWWHIHICKWNKNGRVALVTGIHNTAARMDGGKMEEMADVASSITLSQVCTTRGDVNHGSYFSFPAFCMLKSKLYNRKTLTYVGCNLKFIFTRATSFNFERFQFP